MNSLSRNELIKALVKGLKLDDNIFNYSAVAEETENIHESQFMDFFKAVMCKDSFGNGLKAIIETVEQFKPVQQVDQDEERAKELIQLVYALNNDVYQKHIETGKTFDDLLEVVQFTSLTTDEIDTLNAVKPHCSLKRLVGNINTYENGETQLRAFRQAIKYSNSQGGLIDLKARKMIKGLKNE